MQRARLLASPLVPSLIVETRRGYQAYWGAKDGHPDAWNAILLASFVVALFWHAKLGIQVVIEDYIHTRGTEITLQLLNILACTLGALASLYAIGRIALLG